MRSPAGIRGHRAASRSGGAGAKNPPLTSHTAGLKPPLLRRRDYTPRTLVPGVREQRDSLKRAGRRAVRALGFDLIRYPTRRRTLGEAFEQLRRVGLQPATVIDVGVGDGTWELYEAFADAQFLLVDPVAEFEHVMGRALQRVKGDYAIVAAAAQRGTVLLRVAEDDPQASTMFHDQSSPHKWTEREVPAVPLDDLVLERGFGPPFLMKVDTQGAELEALAGAERTLKQTDAVTLEISLFQFYRGGVSLWICQGVKRRSGPPARGPVLPAVGCGCRGCRCGASRG